jgi:hypothetical protein
MVPAPVLAPGLVPVVALKPMLLLMLMALRMDANVRVRNVRCWGLNHSSANVSPSPRAPPGANETSRPASGPRLSGLSGT